MATQDKSLVASLPPSVREVAQALRSRGGHCWLVGGAVRDAIVERTTRDFDLAVDLPADRWFDLFEHAHSREPEFGSVHLAAGELDIAITMLREEGDYRDHRHPGWVRATQDLVRDAARRDFTCNAIYLDLFDGQITDPYDGLVDLRLGRLRMIGDALPRLSQDPLRILRGLRMAAQYRLEIEPGTWRGMMQGAGLLARLAPERVMDELTRTFTSPGRGRALRLLLDSGAAAVLLPELVAMTDVPQPAQFHPEGDVLTHVCWVLEHAEASAVQAWTAVLHDIGKPATFERAQDRIRFSRHDQLSAVMADTILRRLHANSNLRESVVEVTSEHIRFAGLPEFARTKRERFLRGARFPEHLKFHRADCLGSHGLLDIYEYAQRAWAELPALAPAPLCTGKDVLALGVAAGPAVGQLLQELQSEIETLDITDRTEALRRLQELVASRIKPPMS